MDIRNIHKDSQAILEQLFTRLDHINTMVFYYRPDGKIYCMSRTFESDDEKQYTFDYYSKILMLENALAYSFISEMWFSTVAEKDYKPDIRPMHRSDRKEGVLIVTVKKTSTKCISSMYEILRSENSKELKYLKNMGKFQDNVRLFERCYVKHPIPDKVKKELSHVIDMIPWRFEVDQSFHSTEV